MEDDDEEADVEEEGRDQGKEEESGCIRSNRGRALVGAGWAYVSALGGKEVRTWVSAVLGGWYRTQLRKDDVVILECSSELNSEYIRRYLRGYKPRTFVYGVKRPVHEAEA